MEKLTHQEEEIMLVIWKKKRGIIKDFLEYQRFPRTAARTATALHDSRFNCQKFGEKRISVERENRQYLFIYSTNNPNRI